MPEENVSRLNLNVDRISLPNANLNLIFDVQIEIRNAFDTKTLRFRQISRSIHFEDEKQEEKRRFAFSFLRR